LFCFLFGAPCALAADFYVATNGSDSNAGTIDKPFASIQHAQSAVSPGDTVFIRGGTYAMKESDIARKQRIWVYVIDLDKSGTKDKPITYAAYKDERAIFDLSAIKPPGLRINAFQVDGSWIHLKGLEVTGVQVTIKTHTQSECFENRGSHNIYEQLSMHDSQAIGIYCIRGSDNLFLNCDAYRNYDFTSEGGKGGNSDGFGCHVPEGDTGNIFRGCRAWFNSDDGFDCIHCAEPVTFENCWAFYNGFSPKFEKLADGNGFKAGGWGGTPANELPNQIPHHVVRFCVAVHNKSSGFYANHQLGGGDWFNNTAYRNGNDFNMLCRLSDNRTDVDGYGHVLRNNVAYKGNQEITNFNGAKCDSSHNSFDAEMKLTDADFAGLDEAELTQPRQANGDLPQIRFLHPSDHSRLIDAGIDIGFPFHGARPDLGAFEK
jgi:pectate lyase-like protein/rhamnogalacturonan lyase-like protein